MGASEEDLAEGNEDSFYLKDKGQPLKAALEQAKGLEVGEMLSNPEAKKMIRLAETKLSALEIILEEALPQVADIDKLQKKIRTLKGEGGEGDAPADGAEEKSPEELTAELEGLAADEAEKLDDLEEVYGRLFGLLEPDAEVVTVSDKVEMGAKTNELLIKIRQLCEIEVEEDEAGADGAVADDGK